MPSYPGPQGGRAPPAELNFIPNPFIAEPIPAEKCKSCLPGPRHPRIRLRSNRPRRRSHLPSRRWRPARVTAFRRSSLRSLSTSCSDLSPLGHTWNIPRDAWIRLSRAEENRAPITADIPRATHRIQAVSGIRCRFDSARMNAASISHYRTRYGKYAYSIRACRWTSRLSHLSPLYLRGFSAKFSATWCFRAFTQRSSRREAFHHEGFLIFSLSLREKHSTFFLRIL